MILLIILGCIVAVAMGIFITLKLTADAKLQRLLRKTPHRKIGELGDGQMGRIVGLARPHGTEVLTAPLTGRACVYFIARVEEKFGETWRQVAREEKGVTFEVRDDSGSAVIDPTAARVSLETDDVSQSGQVAEDPLEPREQAFLERHGRYNPDVRNHYRYYEAVIAEGERVAIYGSGIRETDPDGTNPRLRMTSSAARPLVISDAESTTKAQ